MIDLPPLQSVARPTDTVEQLAAAIAEMIAHLYCYVGVELAKQPLDPAGDLLSDKLFDTVADIDAIANYSSGPTVRELLGSR